MDPTMHMGRLGELDLDAEAAAAFAELVQHLRHGRDGKPWCTWAVASIEACTFLIGDARGQCQEIRIENVITGTANAFSAACSGQHQGQPCGSRNDPRSTLPLAR